MKKIIIAIPLLTLALVCAFVVGQNGKTEVTNIMDANAEAIAYNPFCENGCVENGGGCLRYVEFPSYAEYDWGD